MVDRWNDTRLFVHIRYCLKNQCTRCWRRFNVLPSSLQAFWTSRLSVTFFAHSFVESPKLHHSCTKTLKKHGIVAPKSGPFFEPPSYSNFVMRPRNRGRILTPFLVSNWVPLFNHFCNQRFCFRTASTALLHLRLFVYLAACRKTPCSLCTCLLTSQPTTWSIASSWKRL